MKIFDEFINEAAGVPPGLLETGKQIFTNLLDKLDFYSTSSLSIDVLRSLPIIFDGDFVIGPKTIKKIKISFEFETTNHATDLGLLSLSNKFSYSSGVLGGKFKFKALRADGAHIEYVFSKPTKDYKISDLYNYMQNNSKELLSALCHELKHYFDILVGKESSVAKHIDYAVLKNAVGEIKPLNDFLYYSYYLHDIENSVRQTELASIMREEGINKDNFKEFFTNSNIYKELKGIENLTWENFIVSLGNYIPQIETELRNLSIDYSQMSDIEKIDEILAITLSSLKNWKKEELEEFYGPDDKNPMRWFGKKEKFYQDYKKSIEKMGDDHEKFFRSEILKLNSSAKKMIRKLASVYVLAEDNPNKITSNYLFKEGLMWEPITYDAWQKNIELKRWQK
jgi:hypothetical protein